MSYGISLYNSRGEQFYDSNTTGAYMTLTKTIQFNANQNRFSVDTGVPEGVNCLCFSRDISGTQYKDSHCIQVPVNGSWHITGSGNSNGSVIKVYVFSSMPPPKTAGYSYGIQIFDGGGQEIIHNTAKPLSCQSFSMNSGGASFPYQIAATGSMLGFLADPYLGPQQVYTCAYGNTVGTVRRQGGPYDTIIYDTVTMYAIDVSKYD